MGLDQTWTFKPLVPSWRRKWEK